MRRKSFLLAVAMIGILACGALSSIYVLLQHQPSFYRNAVMDPGMRRQSAAAEFQNRAGNFAIQVHDSMQWQEIFSDQQINSWFAEDFISSGLAEQLSPDVSDPRVVFEPGKVQFAFRYKTDQGIDWIVSLEAKAWISPSEPNSVVLEIDKIRAGAIPLSLRFIRDHLAESARVQNIDIRWYRHHGKPTALLRFEADKREPSFRLEALEFRQGSVFVKGQSLDPDLRRAYESSLGMNMPAH